MSVSGPKVYIGADFGSTGFRVAVIARLSDKVDIRYVTGWERAPNTPHRAGHLLDEVPTLSWVDPIDTAKVASGYPPTFSADEHFPKVQLFQGMKAFAVGHDQGGLGKNYRSQLLDHGHNPDQVLQSFLRKVMSTAFDWLDENIPGFMLEGIGLALPAGKVVAKRQEDISKMIEDAPRVTTPVRIVLETECSIRIALEKCKEFKKLAASKRGVVTVAIEAGGNIMNCNIYWVRTWRISSTYEHQVILDCQRLDYAEAGFEGIKSELYRLCNDSTALDALVIQILNQEEIVRPISYGLFSMTAEEVLQLMDRHFRSGINMIRRIMTSCRDYCKKGHQRFIIENGGSYNSKWFIDQVDKAMRESGFDDCPKFKHRQTHVTCTGAAEAVAVERLERNMLDTLKRADLGISLCSPSSDGLSLYVLKMKNRALEAIDPGLWPIDFDLSYDKDRLHISVAERIKIIKVRLGYNLNDVHYTSEEGRLDAITGDYVQMDALVFRIPEATVARIVQDVENSKSQYFSYQLGVSSHETQSLVVSVSIYYTFKSSGDQELLSRQWFRFVTDEGSGRLILVPIMDLQEHQGNLEATRDETGRVAQSTDSFDGDVISISSSSSQQTEDEICDLYIRDIQQTSSTKKPKTRNTQPREYKTSDVQLLDYDIAKIANQQQLNDNIIEFYLHHLYSKLSELSRQKVRTLNPFFFKDLSSRKHAALDVDLRAYDYYLIPIHERSHWILVIICNATSTDLGQDNFSSNHRFTFILNSSSGFPTDISLRLREYLPQSRLIAPSVPQQPESDSINCGIFTLGFAEEFLKNPVRNSQAIKRNESLDWIIDPRKLREKIHGVAANAPSRQALRHV